MIREVDLPDQLVNDIDLLVDAGMFVDRDDAIHHLLRMQVGSYRNEIRELRDDIEGDAGGQ